MAMQLAWIFVIVGPIDIDEWKVIERRRYRGNTKKRERVRAIKTADGQINCHNELRTQMRSAEIRQKKKSNNQQEIEVNQLDLFSPDG